MANKTGTGGFKPGASGNPGGRPKAASVIALEARKHGLAMVSVLNTIARKGEERAGAHRGGGSCLLDRGYGKPSQSVELNFHADILKKTPDRTHAGGTAHSGRTDDPEISGNGADDEGQPQLGP